MLFFSLLSGYCLFPPILSDNLRKELSSYLTRFGTMQRKIFFSFRLSSWETNQYSHSSPSFWLCVLEVKMRQEVMFFAVEVKPVEVRHASTNPLQPNVLFQIWSSQHPTYWIYIIIFRACSQDASVLVSRWGCQHQALQYQCCFILEVLLCRNGVCFLLNFWVWSHRPLWWGEHVWLWLRSERQQQHFVYWLTKGIALVWLVAHCGRVSTQLPHAGLQFGGSRYRGKLSLVRI